MPVLIHAKIKRCLALFCLWFQYYLEPPEKLREALEEKNIPIEDFFVLSHGETKLVASDTVNEETVQTQSEESH